MKQLPDEVMRELEELALKTNKLYVELENELIIITQEYQCSVQAAIPILKARARTKSFLMQKVVCPFAEFDTHKNDYLCVVTDIIGALPECLTKEYKNCQDYLRRVLELSMPMPLICPGVGEANDSCMEQSRCSFVKDYLISLPETDYRKCPIFSKWFWMQRANAKDEYRELVE